MASWYSSQGASVRAVRIGEGAEPENGHGGLTHALTRAAVFTFVEDHQDRGIRLLFAERIQGLTEGTGMQKGDAAFRERTGRAAQGRGVG